MTRGFDCQPQTANCFYLSQLLLILEYCHSSGVAVMNLRPENIFMAPDGRIKLTEFFHAGFFSSGRLKTNTFNMHAQISSRKTSLSNPENDENQRTSGSEVSRRSLDYFSPEALEDNVPSPSADLWAFGCIAYFLEVGKSPFKGKTTLDTITKIRECIVEYPAVSPSFVCEIYSGNLFRQWIQVLKFSFRVYWSGIPPSGQEPACMALMATRQSRKWTTFPMWISQAFFLQSLGLTETSKVQCLVSQMKIL